jgi:hypothetical protein
MAGVRLFGAAGVVVGVALLVFASEVTKALRRGRGSSPAGSFGGVVATGFVWWVRFVGVAFVVVGVAYLIDPSLAD